MIDLIELLFNKGGHSMRIDDYLGLVEVVELDKTAIHEGVLKDVEGTA